MYRSERHLAKMRREFATLAGKRDSLQERYLAHPFKEQRAHEFAVHGFIRRVQTLVRCAENVFRHIPPDRTEPVDHETRRDAEINLQASVFNVFGAIDNLAWVWVTETKARLPNGEEIPEGEIGLRRKNKAVRRTLPTGLRKYVASFGKWFKETDNYRHALAHRIPLYVPPCCVRPVNEARYKELDQLKGQALTSRDPDEYERLDAEQKRMEFFRPLMQHSYSEGAVPIVFHPQLIANFNTADALGNRILDELEAQPGAGGRSDRAEKD